MGAIPPLGSTILVEYIVSDGAAGNIGKEYANSQQYWQFQQQGYLSTGDTISLNDNFRISCLTDIIFGAQSENVQLTQLIAPHMSRSFVLANEINYRYFFQRMNMFSVIEIVKGFSQKETNRIATIIYDQTNIVYHNAFDAWQNMVNIYGESSLEAQEQYREVQRALIKRSKASDQILDSNIADNTVYILLIPDIKKRITSSDNYFTCDESLFTLSDDE